ncbi:serine protease [Streptomyces anulatus]|uniref:S1 family peptidase n=1 Tax=Streptomyces anulatus TaxID=1892 RepID=UPI00386BB5D6
MEPRGQEVRPVRFCGTGFIFAGGLLVTCRHCVDKPVASPNYLAGAVELASGRYKAERLTNICFESTGMDIATARVDADDSPLLLGVNIPGIGQEVGAFGYPGTYGRLPDGQITGDMSFAQEERWLEGYVTRAFSYSVPTGEIRPSWEIDMPTPGGLSGAPLFHLRTQAPAGSGVVIGMCYGRHLAHGEPDAGGMSLPGYVFGLAHYYKSLRDARFHTLGNATLGAYLEGHGAIFDMSQ